MVDLSGGSDGVTKQRKKGDVLGFGMELNMNMKIKTDKPAMYKLEALARCPQLAVIHVDRVRINPYTGYPEKDARHVAFQEVLELASLQNITPEKPKCYSLRAVIVHQGGANFAHYVTYRENAGNWYFCSDEHVRTCTLNEVLQGEAYLLFYEKNPE